VPMRVATTKMIMQSTHQKKLDHRQWFGPTNLTVFDLLSVMRIAAPRQMTRNHRPAD
jgi:hypothetical protein